ncbi:MAG TPA: glycoside hydrolase family 2 TIM barrel-domain containing protein [Bacteroidota bacterium]
MRQLVSLGLLGLLLLSATTSGAIVIPATEKLTLDGAWQFAVDSSQAFTAATVEARATWRTTQVPLSWTLQFEDLRDYQGVAWYRKSFSVRSLQRNETLLLRFDAVDYLTEVYFNGTRVGDHEGGYAPFECEVGRLVKPGENEVLLRVTDPGKDGDRFGGISYLQIPHGKQSWYVQTSGIWQSVHADIVPKRRVSGFHVTPSNDGNVVITVQLEGTGTGGADRVSARILDPHVWEMGVMTRAVAPNAASVRFQMRVKNPMLWSPSTPNLYVAEVQLEGQEPVSDRFGFRSLEARNKQLLLNGEPFYMIGALDQDFYPGTGYTTPSEDFLRDEMIKAKRVGLNTLRCHIKVPDPRYLKIADEIGLVVWYEIPNWDQFTPAVGQRAGQTLDAMLQRDWNHPSLAIISLINESWGLDLKKQDQRAWLKAAFVGAKRKAKGRLVVDNSACSGNFHLKTDINDFHIYWAIPENWRQFNRAVDDVARRPPWLFSPHGDAEETGQEPLLISEFGNWGLPEIPSPPPWWLTRKFGDANVVLPEGYMKRFVAYGLESVFGTWELLADRSQAAQLAALKYEIEQLRLAPQIQGYIITEFTDVHWESNGLLDMWRRVKSAGRDLLMVQQPDVIIPRPVRYNFWTDEPIDIRLWLSHYSARELDGGSVTWSSSTGEHGTIPLGHQDRATVREISPIRVPAFPFSMPQSIHISFSCVSREGLTVAENGTDVYVYPRPDSTSTGPAELYDPAKKLTAVNLLLRQLDPSEASGPGLMVTTRLDNTVMQTLSRGGTVLCLADSTTKAPADFPYTFVRRDTGWYDGNWASSLNWVRRDHPPFGDVNFGSVMGFETSAIGLPLVIGGLKPENFSDVMAGMFVGWLHLNSAYVLQVQAGKGRLVLCTLPLAEGCGRDPYATTVLAALMHFCRRQDVTPGIVWNFKTEGGG